MIVLLLTTKEESDVLRVNVEHHLEWGVDHVCVADNASADDTQDVLRPFGDAVSSVVFDDFGERQRIRSEMLQRVKDRHGRVAWAGVSDTDEFWWAPGKDARTLLADVPDDVPAATFEQKLYLPTELDAPGGAVYARELHRAGGRSSPLFTSYVSGKTWYRGDAIVRVDSEHRNRDVGAPAWWHPVPAVHHYMLRDEDQFVMKVRRLIAWQPRRGFASKRWFQQLRAMLGAPPAPLIDAAFKKQWWAVWREGGEPGLREHYRKHVRVQRADVGRHIASGALAFDDAFARRRAASRTAGS